MTLHQHPRPVGKDHEGTNLLGMCLGLWATRTDVFGITHTQQRINGPILVTTDTLEHTLKHLGVKVGEYGVQRGKLRVGRVDRFVTSGSWCSWR